MRGQKSIRIFPLNSTPEATQAEPQRRLKNNKTGSRGEPAQASTRKAVNVFEWVNSI